MSAAKTLPPPPAELQSAVLELQADVYEREASRLLARANDLKTVAKKLRGEYVER